MAHVCITGGAGFIGSHLADAFLARGDRVTIVDDLSTGSEDNVPAGAALHRLDVRSPEAAELVERGSGRGGIDLLVHQAAQMNVRRSVSDPVSDASINVVGSLNLLEAAARGGVGRVLFASSGGAIYGEQDVYPASEGHPTRPVSPYGVAKLAVEGYLYYYAVEQGMEAVALRYANVYGERQNPHGEAGVVSIFLETLLAGETARINGDGLQTRDYVHVSDVVRANLAAAEAELAAEVSALEAATSDRAAVGGHPVDRSVPFRVYNVGTGLETSVVELYAEIIGALGIDREPVHGPAKVGEQRRSSIDAAKIRSDLGLPEPLSLPEGLRRTAQWFRTKHAGAAPPV